MGKGCRNLTVCFFMLFLNILCAGYAWSEGVSLPDTRNINGPIHVSAENKDWVTHILPTGRKASFKAWWQALTRRSMQPVGRVAMSPPLR